MIFAVSIKKITGRKRHRHRRRVDVVENRRTNKYVIMSYNVPQCTVLDCMQNNNIYISQKINSVQLNNVIIPLFRDKYMTKI